MKKIFPLIVLFFLFSCNKNKTIDIISEGYFKCFEQQANYTCEPSTVAFVNGKIFIGNDKPMPNNNSSVFSFDFLDEIQCGTQKPLNYDLLYKVSKYEASTITPDKDFLLLSSSFSYPITDSVHGKTYNSLVYINLENPEKSDFLHITESTDSNSIDIKIELKNALKSDIYKDGPGYFKVEGLAILPNNKMIFAVREQGVEYGKSEYAIILLAADYKIINEKIKLIGKVKKIYDFNPSEYKNINQPIGISSIEYSEFDERIYFSTSLEQAETTDQIGAYLWYLSVNELNTNQEPHLLLNKENKPFNFLHKIEGIAVLDKSKLLLVGDDDRITGINEDTPTFKRDSNTAYWTIIEIE